jgi:hypothetical protein
LRYTKRWCTGLLKRGFFQLQEGHIYLKETSCNWLGNRQKFSLFFVGCRWLIGDSASDKCE